MIGFGRYLPTKEQTIFRYNEPEMDFPEISGDVLYEECYGYCYGDWSVLDPPNVKRVVLFGRTMRSIIRFVCRELPFVFFIGSLFPY